MLYINTQYLKKLDQIINKNTKINIDNTKNLKYKYSKLNKL